MEIKIHCDGPYPYGVRRHHVHRAEWLILLYTRIRIYKLYTCVGRIGVGNATLCSSPWRPHISASDVILDQRRVYRRRST